MFVEMFGEIFGETFGDMFSGIGITEWIMWLVRWIHGVGAVAWVGGSVFFALVIRPYFSVQPEAGRKLMGPISNMYRDIVDASVMALVVSGLILMFYRLTGDAVSVAWFIVLGVKVALALWMFYLVWRLRRSGLQPQPGRGILRRLSWLLGYNAVMAIGVVIFLLAGLLRTLIEAALAGS